MSTRDTVYIALFAAIVAVLGLFPPLYVLAVPITAQSMGVMLAGSVLGARRGGLAVAVFVLLVAAGLPLLSGGRGGLGVFVGPSGGFVLGYPIVAWAIGWMVERRWGSLTFGHALAFNVIGGVGLLYAIGVPWWSVASGLPLLQVAGAAAVFVPGDLAKASIAAFVAVTVRRVHPVILAR